VPGGRAGGAHQGREHAGGAAGGVEPCGLLLLLPVASCLLLPLSARRGRAGDLNARRVVAVVRAGREGVRHS
jgi:hypothetical protein